MSRCLEYGEVQEIPFHFFGSNYNRDSDGFLLVDQDLYLKELSVQDLDLSHEHETLAPEQQTAFNKYTSVINYQRKKIDRVVTSSFAAESLVRS